MIVTISGFHGTGKTTIGKKIAEILKLKFYSSGQAFRDLAKEKNMSLEKFSLYVEKNPDLEIDKAIDEKVIEVAKKGNIIVDSQLGAYLLEDLADFKILLTCPMEERVKRMVNRDKNNYEEKLKETVLREKSEVDRFKLLYNIDLTDEEKKKKLHNLIIKTENLTVEEIVRLILKKIKTSTNQN